MSWQARRFRPEENFLRLVPTPKLTKHHVPPTNQDRQPRFLKRVDDRHHRAYHLLFQAAASYEDACKILLRDWWTVPAEDPRY
jgi:hypothetical protein